MRYPTIVFFLKQLFFVVLFFTVWPQVQAHNLIPNDVKVFTNDSNYSVFVKCNSIEGFEGIKVLNEGAQKTRFSQFGSLQFVEFTLPLSTDSLRLEILNGAKTSVQVKKNGSISLNMFTAPRVVSALQAEYTDTAFIRPVLEYLELGVEHILIGFDHLLFILGLVFIVRRKRLIWIITTFTIAHSITLGLSTAGVLMPSQLGLSSIWVESMIAISIVILALEMRKEQQNNDMQSVSIAFVFGLLHGYGFAGVLQELGLPPGAFWKALLAFNIGVEVGQLLFIGLLLVLFRLLHKFMEPKILNYVASIFVGGMAAYWSIERILELSLN